MSLSLRPNSALSALRANVRATLAHQQPPAVPMDFGATPVTGMHCSCVAALREHFGLERRPVKVHEPYQMLGILESDLQQALGLSIEGIPGRNTIFGFTNENWKTWRTPWQQEVLVSRDFQTTTGSDGDIYIFPQGDRNAPPSGHMPRSGYFFDSIIRQPPVDDDRLNPQDNLEEFGPVNAADLDYLQQNVQRAKATGRAVLMPLPGTALGDIALVPAPFLKHPRGIRDVEEWYISLATRRDYIHRVFAQQTEIALKNLPRIFAAVGNEPDIVFLCGTDFGTQSSTFCSEQSFRELYLPYYQRITDWIHQHTTWKVFKHSCGAVRPLLGAFIDAGFDILNPVQCSATGMDPRQLKAEYGARLTFWGGGVDTQHILPYGSPEQVRQQVLERCEIFSPGGGFMFNAIHNVQALTPVENIVAMVEAVHEFNGTSR